MTEAQARRRSRRLLLTYGLASLAAVALGAVVCAHSGVPTGLWLRNLGAWAVGALTACGMARWARPGVLPAVLVLTPVGLALTLAAPGRLGVHRWFDLGPLHMNAAMLLLPAAIVALAGSARTRLWPWAAALVSLALLVAQPDASQATTLGLCLIVLAATAPPLGQLRGGVIGMAGLAVAVVWLRADPLQPVPEVEGIVGLAWAMAPLAAVLAIALLVLIAASPILSARGAPAGLRTAAGLLSLCLLSWAVTSRLGAFPVPFVGLGMSPVLGGWLGVGLLAALLRRSNLAVESAA